MMKSQQYLCARATFRLHTSKAAVKSHVLTPATICSVLLNRLTFPCHRQVLSPWALMSLLSPDAKLSPSQHYQCWAAVLQHGKETQPSLGSSSGHRHLWDSRCRYCALCSLCPFNRDRKMQRAAECCSLGLLKVMPGWKGVLKPSWSPCSWLGGFSIALVGSWNLNALDQMGCPQGKILITW